MANLSLSANRHRKVPRRIPSKFPRPMRPPFPLRTLPRSCARHTQPQTAAPASTPIHPSAQLVPAGLLATEITSGAIRLLWLEHVLLDASLRGSLRFPCAFFPHRPVY